MNKVGLYFNTIKHLKFRQIAYRLIYKFYVPRVSSECDVTTLHTRDCFKNSLYILKPIFVCHANQVRFLKQSVKIDKDDIWNDPKQEKLWLYNLHYFDGLCAQDSKQRELSYQLLERWTCENPAFVGNGWEPYPLSLRIVNCIKYALMGNSLSSNILKSLYVQARFLFKNCEYHILGNHLFENYKALCFAGLYFDTDESKNWFNKGYNGLTREVKQQVLADGGHFELSPMYHIIILEGLLDLDNLFSKFKNVPKFPWHEVVQTMLQWLVFMQRPNDEVSYFNDAANDMVASPSRILDYAHALGYVKPKWTKPLVHLEYSGYVIYRNKRIKAIMDLARVGPDYLPGHAHADTLSFELSIDGMPLFINLGTSCYGNTKRRCFERSTAAHNTVVINGVNSSEVWGGFRVARRAKPSQIYLKQENQSIVYGQHNGYKRINRHLIHKRSWCFSANYVEIKDFVAPFFKEGYAFFHLHPSCRVEAINDHKLFIHMGGDICVVVEFENKASVIKSQYARTFGDLVDTYSIKVNLSDVTGQCNTKISW